MMRERIGQLLRVNLLALISLLLALSSLSYNTWRNEASEHNRNLRSAGFALLQELAALQLLADRMTYGNPLDEGERLAGWARVVFIQDLAALSAPPVHEQAAVLETVWAAEVDGLRHGEGGNQRVTRQIAGLRQATMALLRQLK